MTVPQKLKLWLECNAWWQEDSSYAETLKEMVSDLPGFPKVEIDGDPSEEIRFVTTENYNEEKYELLDLETFELVSMDDEEVTVCAGCERQAPLTFTIRAHDTTGKLHIADIYQAYTDGLSFEEFDDQMRNI